MPEPRAPRDDLIRMVPLQRAEASDDGNTLVGYAAVFNDWTEINDWEGNFLERIDPKAFNKTLAERGDKIKVLFNHGFDPQVGDKPLGKPSVMEPREKGLWVEVPLDDTSYNRDLKASLASGAIDGMSFRFSVMGEQWEDGEDGAPDRRTLTDVKLYEFGPVTFPAYEATTAGVRNAGSYKLWRSANRPDGAREEAEPSDDEDRDTSTEEAEASETEDRDTSALDAMKAQITLLRADVARQRREYTNGNHP